MSGPTLEEALRDECCNGCGKPRREWGPVCAGMTQGDFTHYHSPAWWRSRRVLEMRAARAERQTLEQIAARFGVSRQRVAQIIGPTGNVKGRTHGRRSTYSSGCRCDLCREAERAHKRNRTCNRRAEHLGSAP